MIELKRILSFAILSTVFCLVVFEVAYSTWYHKKIGGIPPDAYFAYIAGWAMILILYLLVLIIRRMTGG